MFSIVVSLKDFLVDPDSNIDLTMIPERDAIKLIAQAYGFLSSTVEITIKDGIIFVSVDDEKSKKADEAIEWFNRGIKKAKQGDYQGAIELLKRTLEYLPAHTDARRNLAMAYLELGETEEALNHLIDVLRLDPKDAWGFILLGNIYTKYKQDRKTGEPFYKKAYELNPNDSYLLNNYAAVKAENGQLEEAELMFNKAIEVNPSYPNSYYGLASLLSTLERNPEALIILTKLFDQPISTDPRSAQVYEHSRMFFRTIHEKLADQNYESIMAFIHARANAVEGITGFAVQIVEDASLQDVTAKSELAWKHQTHQHKIRHRPGSKSIVPHLIMHEMEHILLEYEAREVGANRLFVVTSEQRQFARKQIQDDLDKLNELGLDQQKREEISSRWLYGMTNQLYNCPLDMIIESRLYDSYPELRPFQFVSLAQTQREYLQVLTDSDLKKLTPRLLFRSSLAMNCSYAIFTDWLYNNATEYSKPYKASNVFALGERLFSAFLSKSQGDAFGTSKSQRDHFVTSMNSQSEEFKLIEEFADLLGLRGWFSLVPDEQETKTQPEGTTNPELLKQKESATVMYCVDTLKRFENMPQDKIREIAFEVGMLGTSGIDYTKPDRRYSLKALPGEQFSGLQLLVFMYVGFKKFEPTMDTGLDFKDAYEMALKLFET